MTFVKKKPRPKQNKKYPHLLNKFGKNKSKCSETVIGLVYFSKEAS
jgi:hypothetical protein